MNFFSKFTQWLDDMANLSVIKAIRDSLALMIPVIMVGSFAVMINNLPIDIFQNTMHLAFGDNWKNIGAFLARGTYNIISFCVLLSVSYYITIESSALKQDRVHTLTACVVSLCALIILTEPIIGVKGGEGIPYFWTSATGLFVAMLTAITATTLFIKLSDIDILRIDSFNYELDSSLNSAIKALVPAFLTLLFFALVKMFFVNIGHADIHYIVYDLVKDAFKHLENTLPTAMVFNFFMHLFWFFGVHGSNLLEPVALELYQNALLQNADAVSNGLPPTIIITKTFFDVFVYLGGCGSTLCLVFAILFAAPKSNLSKIAKISILPAIFNINEVLLFGLPIVFNPYYVVPFFIVPCVLTLTTYIAFSLEWVPLTYYKTLWTTPIIIGGYMTVGSYSGVVLQLFNLALGTAIYYPFVRLSEQKRMERDQILLKDFYTEIFELEDKKVPVLLTRRDKSGSIARSIALDIKRDLEDDIFVMHYQPQVDNNGRVCGAEALLRWPHREYGMVPPPVVVAVAEEAGYMKEIGDMIIKNVIKQVGEWQKDESLKDLIISFNVSASQMNTEEIMAMLKNTLEENNADPRFIEIELTEGRLLSNSVQNWHMLEQFREIGFRFAIDDFGMGNNSMRYLREFTVDTVKLDGSLTMEVLTDKNSRDIVSSIVQLARNLNLNIIAEFVETKEQQLVLQELGCDVYQGYLYSPAIPAERFAEYVRAVNTVDEY